MTYLMNVMCCANIAKMKQMIGQLRHNSASMYIEIYIRITHMDRMANQEVPSNVSNISHIVQFVKPEKEH